VATVLRHGNYDRVPLASILALMERHGGIARARQRAQDFTERARAIISTLPDSSYQRALYTMTELVTEREY